LVCLAALLVACGGEGDDQTPSRDEVLANLGVNTKPGARKDPDGNKLKASYHPLTRKHRTLAPLSELFFAGIAYSGSYLGVLDDDKDGGLASLYGDSDPSWAKLPMVAGKGDVDGDGYDEIVLVYYVEKDELLKLHVIDRKAGKYVASTSTLAKGVKVDAKALAGAPFRDQILATRMSLAVGDLDGDGRDELAVGFEDKLRVVDDAAKDHAALASRSFASADSSAPNTILSLGIGDFSGDGKQRLVVVANQHDASWNALYADYALYEGALAKELLSEQLIVRDGASTHVFKSARVAVGDIDGDRLDEVVFCAYNGSAYYLALMDDQRAKGAFIGGLTAVSGALVALLDMDADGAKEIAVGKQVLGWDSSSKKLAQAASLSQGITFSVAAGDLDGDFREDLIVPAGSALVIYATDKTGTFAARKSLPASCTILPALVAANMDKDSLVVEYTGKQELLFTDPQLLAVMAAPPAYSGIGQQDGSTTFGKTKGTEVEASASLGVSVGFSIGAKGGFKLFGNGVELEAKQTFTFSMDWTFTATTSIATSYAFTGGADEDKVVFTSVPFDVYYYKVLSSPDPKAVGQIISINMPRKPQTFSVSRAYYNANNGDAQDVDASVLPHTIGDPWTYPSRADRDQHLRGGLKLLKSGWTNPTNPLLGGWVNDTMVTVGQGGGSQTLTIEAERSLGLGVELGFSRTIEAQATIGPAIVGGSTEFRVGVGLAVTASEGFFVEGTIGDIPAEHFSGDRLYRAGIYAYPHVGSDGGEFMVVNYWVEQ
jgi:hypothetical protein